MMSAKWVSVKIMVPSECRPTGFLPTARPPSDRLETYSLQYLEVYVKEQPSVRNAGIE